MNTHKRGFTLVELLIVIIILAIISAIALPQFGSSTESAKLSTLKSTLNELRNSIELYYHQHNSRYPGQYLETDGTTLTTTAAQAEQAFITQLTQYTDINGEVSGTKDSTYKFGPYLKRLSLPDNPFMTGTSASDLVVDITTTDITVAPTSDGTTGWKFYLGTGRMVANDGLTLTDGTVTVNE